MGPIFKKYLSSKIPYIRSFQCNNLHEPRSATNGVVPYGRYEEVSAIQCRPYSEIRANWRLFWIGWIAVSKRFGEELGGSSF